MAMKKAATKSVNVPTAREIVRMMTRIPKREMGPLIKVAMKVTKILPPVLSKAKMIKISVISCPKTKKKKSIFLRRHYLTL